MVRGILGAGNGGVVEPAVTRLVATRGEMPFQLHSNLAANQVKRVCRTRHHFARQDVTEMQLMWCGFYTNGSSGEVNIGNAQTLNASVEIVGAPIPLVRVTFGGSNQGSIANGATSFLSDRLTPDMFGLSVFPKNGEFWVKDEREVPTSGALGNCGSVSNPAISGEGILAALTGAPTQVDTAGALVADGNWATPTSSQLFMPIAFIGKTVLPEISAMCLGDSVANRVADFSGDGVNTAGGYIVRSFSSLGRIPYVNFGNPSERASLFSGSNGTKRRAIIAMLGITHTIMKLGENDGGNGRTAQQAFDDNKTIRLYLKSIGVSRIAHCSPSPRVTSTDSYRTLANQTPTAGFETGGSFRDPLRALFVAAVGSDGLDAYVNLDAAWADSTQPDRWIVDGSTAALSTPDGIHPSRLRHGNATTILYNAEISAWTPTPF